MDKEVQFINRTSEHLINIIYIITLDFFFARTKWMIKCTLLSNPNKGEIVMKIGKRLLSLFLCVGMLLSTIPPFVHARSAGACGDNLIWSINNGVLTISGEGDMYDFVYDDQYHESTAPWATYLNTIEKVVIEDGVTSVGDYAFYYWPGNIEEIVIGDDVTRIGRYVFDLCESLKKITFGESVEFVGFGAFYCWYLEEVHIPSLESWFNITFEGASSNPFCGAGAYDFAETYLYCDGKKITDLVIPESVTQIKDYALYRYENLSSITIPESVISIGEQSFCECEALTNVTYLGNISELMNIDCADAPFGSGRDGCGYKSLYIDGELATDVVIPEGIKTVSPIFDYCQSVSSIVLPKTITEFKTSFGGCNNLKSIYFEGSADEWVGISFCGRLLNADRSLYFNNELVTDIALSEGITSIQNYSFYNCLTLKNIVLPESLISIGHDAFNNCVSLQEITVPKGVLSIPNRTFQGCTLLAAVKLENVQEIGNSAFSNCTSLSKVVLGNREIKLGESVFANCTAIDEVRFGGQIEDWLKLSFTTAASNPCSFGAKLYIDSELVETVTIPDTVTVLKQHAFRGCESITSVVIPNHVTNIESYAFYGCKNLTNTTLSESLTTINPYTFGMCSSLEGLVVPDGVENIASGAFYNSEKLKTVNIPKSMTVLNCGAFGGCTNFTSLTIPAHIISLEDGVPSNIKKVFFEGDLPTMSSTCFSGVTAYCYYPAGNETYADSILKDYGGTLVWIPVSDSGTVSSEFCGENVKWYLSDDGILKITGTGAMYDYSIADSVCAPWYDQTLSITSVEITEGVTSIGNDAFYTCSEMKSVVIPDSVTSIGDSAFYKCGALSSVTLPENLNSIGKTAFYYNTALTKIVIPDHVTSIGVQAFSGCQSLQSAVIGASVTDIPNAMFSSCYELSRVTFPDGIKTLGDSAFSGCYELDSFILPEGLTHIGKMCFALCGFDSFSSGFGSITLPSTLEYIGDSAFYYCSDLSSVQFTGGKFTLGSQLFRQNQKKITIVFKCVAPTFSEDAFGEMVYAVTAYYPSNEESWTAEVLQNYGGKVTWISQDMEITVPDDGTAGDGSDGDGEGTDSGSGEGTPGGGSTGSDSGSADIGASAQVQIISFAPSSADIEAPVGGWTVGQNTFTVTCEFPCVVSARNDGGKTYTRLMATATDKENTYSFTVPDVTASTIINIGLVGDINWDEQISNADVTRLKAYYMGKLQLDAVTMLYADVNCSGSITNADVTKLKAVYQGKAGFNW